MKTKYVIVYLAVGMVFLAVSLWAFLSNGKSAKAIRCKYKLGGIMLTAWAMLSAASCEGPAGPFVTCYDPVPPDNSVSIFLKETGGTKLKNGDILIVGVNNPTYLKYRCYISSAPESGEPKLLQTQDFARSEDEYYASCEITLNAGDYKGKASARVVALTMDQNGSDKEVQVNETPITIL